MFLEAVAAPGKQLGETLNDLSAADVTRFVAGWARSRSHAYSKSMVSALRSLLRFLHVAGYIARPLDTAVPAVPGWEPVREPHRVSGREIAAVLAACDRESARGRRDYAILMLLARLGLRAAEVAGIRLGDIDWRQGVLTVRGKGSALDELPVPADVGAAMADYVRHGRPRSGSRLLFVSVRAPFAGLSAASVGSVVHRACGQAGLTGLRAAPAPPRRGLPAPARRRLAGRDRAAPPPARPAHHCTVRDRRCRRARCPRPSLPGRSAR